MPTLHWIGKGKVINHHHDVPFRVLDHQSRFSSSENDNITSNKIIQGDNLEALKA
jgi:adenine-specific DNA-methyltransferase